MPTRGTGVGRKTAAIPWYTGENPHLVLEHVHGTCGPQLSRGLISPRESKGRVVIYAASAVLVVHDMQAQRQRFFGANDGARVAAMALHPDEETMASCHMAGSGKALKVALRFWSWSTVSQRAEPLDVVLIARRHGLPSITDVRAIAFSKYGDLVFLLLEHRPAEGHPVEGAQSSSIMAVEWRHPHWLAHRSHVALLHSRPAALEVNTEGDGCVVVAGAERLSMVPVSKEGELKTETAFKYCGSGDVLLCVRFIGSKVVAAGSAAGSLWLCDVVKARVLVKCSLHSGPLFDLAVDAVRVVTVGADGYVREYCLDEDEVLEAAAADADAAHAAREIDESELTEDMATLVQAMDVSYHFVYGLAAKQAQEISFGALPLRQWHAGEPGRAGAGGVELRSVCVLPAREVSDSGKPDRGGLVLTTGANEMLTLSGTIPITVTLLQTGHSAGTGAGGRGGNRRRQEGVTGLSCHPVLPIFATCGSDGTVRVWNAEARCMVMARVAFSKQLPGAALLRACQRDRSCAPVRLRLRVREGH